MEKKLEKAIKEEIKIKEQLKALQDRLNDVADKREMFEKETLHKHYKDTQISLEEYQMIVRTAVDDYKGLNDILDKGAQNNDKGI